jgi:hypothetical protein
VITQDAPQKPKPSLLPLWRDLNVFVAAFAVIISLGSFAVFVPLSIVLKLGLPSRQAELLAWPLGYVLVTAFLCWRWWKHRLSPRQIDRARQTRFFLGHVLLAFFNVGMVGMFLVPWLIGSSLLPPMPAVARMSMALMSLAPMGLIAGLVMVLSARGTAPAFANTLPAGVAVPRQTPSANWPPKSPGAGSAPSVIVVGAGLVISSLVLYMAGVFGALAFAGRTELLNVVGPVAAAVYVVYVMTAAGLLFKRKGAANMVAWAPIILVFGAVAVVQVGMMFSLLVG